MSTIQKNELLRKRLLCISQHAEIWSTVLGDENTPLLFVKLSEEGHFPAPGGSIPSAEHPILSSFGPPEQGGRQTLPAPASGAALGCLHGAKRM